MSEWQTAWRIFEIDKRRLMPKTLMHPHRGSKFLPLDTAITAYQGVVSNPGVGTHTYRAGWHVGLDLSDIQEYIKIFTAPRTLCVCRVEVKHLRKKPRATSPIWLAKEMRICSEDWLKAVEQYG